MRIAAVFFLSFVINNAFGQINERLWEAGKLTWKDFEGEAFLSSRSSSELHYQLGYSTVRKKIKDTVIYRFQTRNYINTRISWIKPSDKTEEMLRYNQVLFDIIELSRRDLQREINRIDNIYLAEEKLRAITEICSYEVKKFQEATLLGSDHETVTYWQKLIEKQLSDKPLESMPKIVDRKFGYGMNIGMGSGRFTKTLSDHFSNSFNFIFGFDLAYNKAILFLNGTLAGNRVRTEFMDNGIVWQKNMKTNVAIIDVSLGQTLLDNSRHKLTPFFGLGILEFSVPSSVQNYEAYRIVDHQMIYGINYDLKWRKTIRLTPAPYFGNFKERAEQNIRLRIYTTSGKFSQFQGSSVNLTIGYSIFGRKIGIQD